MEEKRLKGIKIFIIGEALVLSSLVITFLAIPGGIISLVGLFSMANLNEYFKKAIVWRIIAMVFTFFVVSGTMVLTVILGLSSYTIVSVIAGVSAIISLIGTINYLNGFNQLANNFGESEIANRFSLCKKYYIIVTIIAIGLVMLSTVIYFLSIFSNIAGYVSAGISLFIILTMYSLYDSLKNKTSANFTNHNYNANENQNNYNSSNMYKNNQQINPEITTDRTSADKNREEIYKNFEG